MRHSTLLVLSSLFLLPRASAQHITIVESTSVMSGHIMDSVWSGVATDMGYTAEIMPQTVLDDISDLAATDILIVSSGLIELPTTRLQTVDQFAQSGRPCYIQSEYLPDVGGNNTFASVMTAESADFHWMLSQEGDLAPVIVSGALSSTPNAVSILNYFWYGCEGAGTGVQSFLTKNGVELGWIHAADAHGGMVITTTDQDWVKDGISPDLMQNILFMLAGAANGISTNALSDAITVRSSITDDQLFVSSSLDAPSTLILRDIHGRELRRSTLAADLTLDIAALSPGAYVYEVRTRDGRTMAGKVVKM